MTHICTGSPPQPLIVNSRTSPSAWRASNARFSVSIARSPEPSAAAREERRRVRGASRARTRAPSRRAIARIRRSMPPARRRQRRAPRRPRQRRQPPQADATAVLEREQQRARVGRPARRAAAAGRAAARACACVRCARSRSIETPLVVERALGIERMEDERATVRRVDRRRRRRSPCPAVSTRLRRVARSTVTMSRRLIIRGSAPRSTDSAISRPSGAMSKSSAFGSHGGSARPVPASASRQRPVATSQTNTCGSRPSVSQWSQKRNSARSVTCALTLASLLLLPAFRLLRVGGEIRPDPGHEGDPLAVGEPFDRRASGGKRREPPRLAAVRRDQVDLRLVVVLALRGERDRSLRPATTSDRCPCRRR